MAEAKTRRKGGCLTWAAIVVAVLLAAFGALWVWAANNDSVATLDTADRLFTNGDAQLVAGPVAFGEGAEQALYVHRPANARGDEALPVLVWIHGGAWRDGDPKDYGFVARNLAPEGFVVVNVGYRKGDGDEPGGKFPQMLEDGAAALRWVSDNIADAGGDPTRVYLMGHSAGAYNAVMLGLNPQWLAAQGLSRDMIGGVIGLAGPYDFLPLDVGSTQRTFGDVEALEETQPINLVRTDAPPMLLLHGSEDTVVRPRNSRVLAEQQSAAGGVAEAKVFEGQDHADIVMTLARPFDRDARTKRAILDWLAAREAAVSSSEPSSPIQATGG